MAMEINSAYSNVYESTYAAQRKEVDSQKKAEKNAEVKESTPRKVSNEEYLKSLQKQVPYMKLQVGEGINTRNDGKVNIVDVSPKLLEKMQNDPVAAKEYTQRLKDVEGALKFADSFSKSMGYTVACSHSYIDENGKFSHFAVVVKKDLLNEKLRKEAQENAEKRIEKSRENNRIKAEQFAEKMEETEKKQDEVGVVVDKSDMAKNRAEDMLAKKIVESDDGEIYLNHNEMQLIVEATKERNADKTNYAAGQTLDYKI